MFCKQQRIYKSDNISENVMVSNIITEDSKTGYEFYNEYAKSHNMICEHADGKTNVSKRFINKSNSDVTLIVVDGAAYGSEMNNTMILINSIPGYILFTPESFEWLLLNSNILNKPTFAYSAPEKKAQMVKIKENVNTPSLHAELLNLMELYPEIKPAIYVWNYETENYIDINADKIYSTASIIKIPVLIDLFKTIELGQIRLTDTIPLREYFRTEGSGNLQFKAANSIWTIDELAKRMITISDNSATNMLMTELGSMEDVNRSIRNWGLKNTEVKTWLPDLRGNNHTTAREMGQMLYNIDSNEKFLSEFSRAKIFNYMGHVKNDRLIQAGLGAGSTFLHKTGDIGSMLGDAGIVTTPNGKKYIAVIMANRPHNDPKAEEFIVKASEIIYNYMVK